MEGGAIYSSAEGRGSGARAGRGGPVPGRPAVNGTVACGTSNGRGIGSRRECWQGESAVVGAPGASTCGAPAGGEGESGGGGGDQHKLAGGLWSAGEWIGVAGFLSRRGIPDRCRRWWEYGRWRRTHQGTVGVGGGDVVAGSGGGVADGEGEGGRTRE